LCDGCGRFAEGAWPTKTTALPRVSPKHLFGVAFVADSDVKMDADSPTGSSGGDLSSKMSGLNVNAASFVPNVNAPVFVPTFATASQPPPPAQTPVVSLATNNSNGPADEEMVVDGAGSKEGSPSHTAAAAAASDAADSWEDAADDSAASGQPSGETPATTPEDEDVSMSEGGSGRGSKVPASKPKTKVKPVEVEATTTEKEHVNVVFIGHVDAGKSTIGGQMMYLTGMVDKRTLEKYEREAKEKNRETWYLSWCMDTNQEERDKGKTVEVGRGYFETETKHFTILDAPGHKSFVPNMISGASQADLAVLVISARKGEFETGFERGGQTREHAMLVKTAGVKHMVVLINKMDDPTVGWDKARYDECKDKLTPYLRKVGFNPAKDVKFMPCSGLTGAGLKEPVGAAAPWYTDESFIPYIDGLPAMKRNIGGPFMMPIVDKFADMGTILIGKVESGECKKGQTLAIYPNRTEVKVDQLWSDDIEVTKVTGGENIKVKIKGVEEDQVQKGFVLCDPNNPIKSCKTFDAQVAILDYASIICAGKTFVLHLQAIIEEVTLKALICLVDKKTGEKSKTRPRFIKQDQIAIVRFQSDDVICMETFKDHPQLGRFTLRDEGKTIAIGKVLKLVDSN